MSTMNDKHHGATSGSMDRAKLPRSNDPRALYVITLFSSLMPMPLEVPDPRGLEGLAVFRSRRVEDGRERYRLHLGYFDSRTDAEDTLPIVQRHFPSAWVASAPASGLGSLDDTNLSEFRLIRSPALMAAELEARSSPPPAPAQNAQRYVVQLSWSDNRVDTSEISQLAIFQAYALYTVTLARAGVRYYGIRLGFFTSAISARQVSLYVRSEFPEAAVVPISEREYTHARETIAQRAIRATPKVVAEAAPESAASTESIAIETPERESQEVLASTETAPPGTAQISVAVQALDSAATQVPEVAPIHVPEPASVQIQESASTAVPPASLQVPEPVPETGGTSGAAESTVSTTLHMPAEPSAATLVEAQAEAASAISPPDVAEAASPAPVETDTESPPPDAPRRPFTEVYAAEAAARISARVQTHPLAREDGLSGLGAEELRGTDADHRSALARLLHRLADRLS